MTWGPRLRKRPVRARGSVPWMTCLLVLSLLFGQRALGADPAPEAPSSKARGNLVSAWVDRTVAISGVSNFPPTAEDCAIIYDPVGHRVLIFGGKGDDDLNTNDVWALDLARNAWAKIVPRGESPPAVEDHTAIYDPNGHRAIIHGGEDGFSRNSTWAFDLKTEVWRDITSASGPTLEDHSAIYEGRGKRMVIFGGRNQQADHDDVDLDRGLALNLDPASPSFEKWTDLSVKADEDVGRCEQVAVWDQRKNRMVIYGGWRKKKKDYLGDTWAFSFGEGPGASGRWSEIKTKKSRPPKRRHVVGVYDARHNWMVICGGYGDEGYLNDAWAFDLEADVWINVTPGPQPRLDHRVVFDPVSGNVLVYGGDARLGNKLHDLWELALMPEAPLDQMLSEAGGKASAGKGAPPAEPQPQR